MLKSFRYLLFPFAFLHWIILQIRNFLFEKNILKSAQFNFPVICIGNLAVGGTGKTPMTEYVIRLLKEHYRTAVVSRGYRRKTKGYALAGPTSTVVEIGDEPMQIHNKYPEVTVAVGEERLVAIPQLLHDKPDTEVIVLDDAFQHRSIKAGLNILLTEYNNLFTRDHVLPVGDLRDIKSGKNRAHVIIVTKCPPNLSPDEKKKLTEEIAPKNNQQLFFTCLEYGTPYDIFNQSTIQISENTDVLLLCAIANPEPLKNLLNEKVSSFDMMRYRDHHSFSTEDLYEITETFGTIESGNKIILTTEKDAVRLQKFKNELSQFPVYAIPVQHRFLFEEGEKFNNTVLSFVREATPKLI